MKILQVLVWSGMLLLLPISGIAQRGSGGWCTQNNYNRQFNTKTIEELKGSVVKVERITPETGMSAGIHLILKTEKNETIPVHLGPAWYVENQEIQLVAGDVITVKGSRITYQAAPAIIAMTISKGAQILTLRDKNGNPGWNAWRQGKNRGRGRMNN